MPLDEGSINCRKCAAPAILISNYCFVFGRRGVHVLIFGCLFCGDADTYAARECTPPCEWCRELTS
jgi:hypothetical protein